MLLYTCYELFLPHVSIESNQLPKPDNPFYYPFYVKNNGKLRISDFYYELKLGDLLFKNGARISGGTFVGLDIDPYQDTIPTIRSGGTHQISLTQFIDNQGGFESSHITIRYFYHSPVFKIKQSDSIKFVLLQKAENEYIWNESQFDLSK